MRHIIGIVAIALLSVGGCASSQVSFVTPYRGQIIDADTGNPLSGVLVVFIWYRDVYSPATSRVVEEFHAAVEVRSGADGYFQVSDAAQGALGSSVVHVQSPAIIFFAPNYIQHRIEVKPGGKRFRDPTRVYMKRAENPRDTIDLGLAPSFPYNRTPLLLNALNEERIRLRLPPIEQSGKEKRND